VFLLVKNEFLIQENLLLLKILMPLTIAVLLPFFHGTKLWMAKALYIGAIFISWMCSVTLLIGLYTKGPFSYYFSSWISPWGIEFQVGYLSVFTSIIILSMAFLVGVYSLADIQKSLETNQIPRYYSLFLLLVFSLLGIALTNDIFNLFVFIEISTISAVSLITIVNKKQNIEAGIKYLVLSALGSGCILFAIALIYMVTGNLNMTFIGAEMVNAWQNYPRNILAASSFFVVGFSVKSAIFPVHVWLPDAYTYAPNTSSAILSGIVTKTYAVAMIKILFTIFGVGILQNLAIESVFLVLASLSILFGSVFAITQADIKRMLAYSSVAQIGYVYLGIDLANEAGLSGALLHILNHAIMKVGLFLIVGIIIHKTGKRRIDDFRGLGREMPMIMFCFTALALSMIGIPPFSGFFSKYYLALGAIEANKHIYVVVILVSSLLNALYYLPIIISSFFNERDDTNVEVIRDRIPKTMVIPVLILTFGSLFFGLFYTLPLDVISRAVIHLLGQGAFS
jgi:multicomponent Na+:H+ antiporter subunit D